MQKKSKNFFRFLSYVKPYWKYIFLAVIGGIVKFTVPLLVPQVTRHLIDKVYLNTGLTIDQKLAELFFYVGGMILIFIFIYTPFTYVRHFCAAKAGQRSVFDLRCDLYYQVLKMSSSFFNKHKSGGIVSRLINDIQMAQDLVGNALTNVWMDTIAVFVILFFMFQIDISLTFVALATFPLYIIVFKKLGGKLKTSTRNVQKEIENMSGILHEKISGSIVVRAFAQEKREEQTFNEESETLFSKSMRTNFLHSLNMALTGVLTNTSPLIVTIYGGYQVIHGNITVGELIAITMYLGPLYLPLQRFSELNAIFSSSMAALDRIFEMKDEDPEIKDKHDAVDINNMKGKVDFENVTFSYKEGHKILDDISFSIEAGQKIAIVGHSGSGKTTITSLLPRFYDVKSGSIKIDEIDIRNIKLNSLRKNIGIVLQDPILFSGTVSENILYGNPKAAKEELIQACKDANAFDFIQHLEKKYDTEVGERGAFLSGGQKQRLTIARAFLRNPKILILDEATSSLDSESEKLIKESLDRLMENRTTFIIAHRLSTVINADKILVLHHGKIVESGTHSELVELNGVYQGLYHKQFSAKEN
jgi:ATP-binding cassette, subfamily B, putative efflux pump